MPYKTMASDLSLGLDISGFMRSIGFIPDKWQSDFLQSVSKRVLLNCSRQSGKSTVTSVMALHKAIYSAGSLILLLSPSLRQSLELYKKVVDGYLALGNKATADVALSTV